MTISLLRSVGFSKPIELPVINIASIHHKIGNKVAEGNIGAIYQVKDSTHLFKAIPLKNFQNGNEIRISKIAGEIGVSPRIYEAFLLEQSESQLVVIEMEDAGKSMGQWMEALAPQEEEKDEPQDRYSEQGNPALRAILARLKAMDPYTVVEIKKPHRLSLEEAIDKLYRSREIFYCDLFSKIKRLNENMIAYGDTHVGNIMPQQRTGEDLQLIDFDCAQLMETTELAVTKSLSSAYTQVHWKAFTSIPEKSAKSIELIKWFTQHSH